jgi:hypothetical protein
LVVEHPPIAFIPEHPRDENDSGIKATTLCFGEQLPGRGPPLSEVEDLAGRSQMFPDYTLQYGVPNFPEGNRPAGA